MKPEPLDDLRNMFASGRSIIWFALPFILAFAGIGWMGAAVHHYEQLTGRHFYGLAAQHYSVPDWGMKYYPGGEAIEMWTVEVPAWSTLSAILLTAFVAVLVERKVRSVAWVVALLAWHVIAAVGFFMVAGWYSINVTGVFI